MGGGSSELVMLRTYKQMKNKNFEQSWDEYSLAENDRIRSVYQDLLGKFLDCAEHSTPEKKEKFVFNLSSKIIDKNDSFPLRMPLFERLLFPVLYNGFLDNKKNCARWLAGFSLYIFKSTLARKELGDNIHPNYFLEKALALDPNDNLARGELIKKLAYELEYSIHEVPTYVLWDNSVADIESCKMLQDKLESFTSHVKIADQEDIYSELIRECKFHFQQYQNYLKNIRECESYAQHIESLTA
ncbi:MAG: hypothetical protein OEM02_09065 [Desulfobulbaceae bacterium]|nr:hypothetical protein [Desulfobulbaceae bacterium]